MRSRASISTRASASLSHCAIALSTPFGSRFPLGWRTGPKPEARHLMLGAAHRPKTDGGMPRRPHAVAPSTVAWFRKCMRYHVSAND